MGNAFKILKEKMTLKLDFYLITNVKFQSAMKIFCTS